MEVDQPNYLEWRGKTGIVFNILPFTLLPFSKFPGEGTCNVFSKHAPISQTSLFPPTVSMYTGLQSSCECSTHARLAWQVRLYAFLSCKIENAKPS
uniref:Uncharacterized protein n=1 Tax=Arundo donax TaxID=35708 RepID=A0A0A9GEX2_ARUDO